MYTVNYPHDYRNTQEGTSVSWFWLALLPSALWAASNYLDKYLVSRFFKGSGVGTLMIFSALIGLVMLPVAALIHPAAITTPPINAWLIALNGCLYLLAVLPYLIALQKSDVSTAISIWQLIPVFSFVLAKVFLNESLNTNQMVGGLIVVLGAVIITFEMQEGRKIKFHASTLLLMLLSSILFAVSFLFFKVFALQADLWTTAFWEYVGFVGFGIFLLVFIKSYRRQFVQVLRDNSATILSLNALNEIINIVGKLLFNYASLLAPITLAWVAVGFQPVFALLFGTILTIFWPHIVQENIARKHLIQKGIAIGVMLAGAFILH